MAGYQLKIVLENTHPPVWRRVVIPDKITFSQLHQIIQLLFGWNDRHLHEFRIPSADVCIDNEKRGGARYHYQEDKTLVAWLIEDYNWIRYTYDFGDDWRHKIICEKVEDEFKGRSPVLVKFKGDNFAEDYNPEWDDTGRITFEAEEIQQKLAALSFPQQKSFSRTQSEKEMYRQAEALTKEWIQTAKKEFTKKKKAANKSEVCKQEDGWVHFAEAPGQETVKYGKSSKTMGKLLAGLTEEKTEDYCKYLQVAVDPSESKEKKAERIAEMLKAHPEYILYILSEEEY